MSNNWKIPKELELKIRQRDKICIYCKKQFKKNAKDRATWEHIDNDAKNITESNITLCCGSCNASKGAKNLNEWLKSDYCKEKNINRENISI